MKSRAIRIARKAATTSTSSQPEPAALSSAMQSRVQAAYELTCDTMRSFGMGGVCVSGTLLLHEKLRQMGIDSTIVDGYASFPAGPRLGQDDPITGRSTIVNYRLPWSLRHVWLRVNGVVYDVGARVRPTPVPARLETTPSHRISDMGPLNWRPVYASGTYWKNAPPETQMVREMVMRANLA